LAYQKNGVANVKSGKIVADVESGSLTGAVIDVGEQTFVDGLRRDDVVERLKRVERSRRIL